MHLVAGLQKPVHLLKIKVKVPIPPPNQHLVSIKTNKDLF